MVKHYNKAQACYFSTNYEKMEVNIDHFCSAVLVS